MSDQGEYKMKKIISFILVLAMIISSFGVCGCNDVSTTVAAQKKAESYQLKNGKIYKKSGHKGNN